MLEIIDITVMIVGGIACLIAYMDLKNIRGFKIKNDIIRNILYLLVIVCGLIFFITDFFY